MVDSKQKMRTAVPSELNNVVQVTVDRIQERLDKCYSQEDYKKFREDVCTIALEALAKDEGREKIKVQAKTAAKEYIEEEGWKKRTFWIPTLIALTAAVASVIALFK